MNHIDKANGRTRFRLPWKGWMSRTKAGMKDQHEREALATDIIEKGVELNQRRGEALNTELAATITSGSSTADVATKVGSLLDRETDERVGPHLAEPEAAMESLENLQNQQKGSLAQMETEVGRELGKKQAFGPHVREGASLGFRAALAATALAVTAFEIGIIHGALVTQILPRISPVLARTPGSYVATGIVVGLVNGLTWLVTHMSIDHRERTRLADLTDTEPPQESRKLTIQLAVLFIIVVQVLLVFVRFKGDSTGHTNPVLSALSIIAIVSVTIIALGEAALAGSPKMWKEEVLARWRTLHASTYDELPRAIAIYRRRIYTARIRVLREIANVIAPAWSTAAQEHIAKMEEPKPVTYELKWPDVIPPVTGRWGRAEQPEATAPAAPRKVAAFRPAAKAS